MTRSKYGVGRETSDIDFPGLAHEIVNRFALEFFDKYLRHGANTPLLSGEQAYPEVTLVKHAWHGTLRYLP